ncbi:dienelactone hydrolase family protein [Flagellimonas meridianipacifica]|uniref:Acetyl esterase/lipase n=1 Tax=Flagellimonas meridianipacifica TaxID=1080225 RepID=A0A2T0MIW5_9FLAO|nr:alpha/beta hydrolase [Allomuricauda pacifica]PRX57446.1 acetyl esterase/lipase [Allomuricauda pacifica]
MNTTRKKIALKLIFALVLVCFGCSNDSENNLGSLQNAQIIPSGTSKTLVQIPVGDYEIPVFLSIPEGCPDGPLPAVVVMHGSDGMWTNKDPSSETMSGQFIQWQNLLAENCIVGAFVDSYSGRGVTTRTGKWRELPDNFKISAQFERPKDANAALSLLQNLEYEDGSPIVEEENIALLGFSDGASAVVATMLDTNRVSKDFEWTQSQNGKEYGFSDGVLPPQSKPEIGFSGAVFYYGGSVGYNYFGKHPCGSQATEGNVFLPYAPILFQIPSNDVLTENTLCLFEVLKSKEAPVEMNYYEGVAHGFDFDGLPESDLARKRAIEWFKKLWSKN